MNKYIVPVIYSNRQSFIMAMGLQIKTNDKAGKCHYCGEFVPQNKGMVRYHRSEKNNRKAYFVCHIPVTGECSQLITINDLDKEITITSKENNVMEAAEYGPYAMDIDGGLAIDPDRHGGIDQDDTHNIINPNKEVVMTCRCCGEPYFYFTDPDQKFFTYCACDCRICEGPKFNNRPCLYPDYPRDQRAEYFNIINNTSKEDTMNTIKCGTCKRHHNTTNEVKQCSLINGQKPKCEVCGGRGDCQSQYWQGSDGNFDTLSVCNNCATTKATTKATISTNQSKEDTAMNITTINSILCVGKVKSTGLPCEHEAKTHIEVWYKGSNAYGLDNLPSMLVGVGHPHQKVTIPVCKSHYNQLTTGKGVILVEHSRVQEIITNHKNVEQLKLQITNNKEAIMSPNEAIDTGIINLPPVQREFHLSDSDMALEMDTKPAPVPESKEMTMDAAKAFLMNNKGYKMVRGTSGMWLVMPNSMHQPNQGNRTVFNPDDKIQRFFGTKDACIAFISNNPDLKFRTKVSGGVETMIFPNASYAKDPFRVEYYA